MRTSPIRRAQLVAPFGVGSMVITRDGVSLIAAGLDHWFERETGGNSEIELEEYIVEEWRLQGRLQVDHFRLPPDYRETQRGQPKTNTRLTVPYLRFPRWHFCRSCHHLYDKFLEEQGDYLGRLWCPTCEAKKKRGLLIQVPFVAVCEHGHIQDFPWKEWVHRSSNPQCDKPMYLHATGGASLSAQKVTCECEVEPRTLSGITTAYPDGSTVLSNTLARDGTPHLCQGLAPWLGHDEGPGCILPLRGSLRSASNVYFAQVRSAIYVPRGGYSVPSRLLEIFEQPPVSTWIHLLRDLLDPDPVQPSHLRKKDKKNLLVPFTNEQLQAALELILAPDQTSVSTLDMSETTFRRAEFQVLRGNRDDQQLKVAPSDPQHYGPEVADYFSGVSLVEKLRETRVLAGFTRVFPENQQTLEQHKDMLWRNRSAQDLEWLPATIVRGEGIFLELNEQRLQEWEVRTAVEERVGPLAERYKHIQLERHLRERLVTPRFLLLHTLAHLLINRFTFECGYSSASLRERLYVSADRTMPMAAILIYTAAGDSEGTLGGLVRMGKPGVLDPVVRRAVEMARWCSADPVCMDIGNRGGQGTDSCNLAACHNCALVPETACEEFNRFLDRGVVVGKPGNRSIGFFAGLPVQV